MPDGRTVALSHKGELNLPYLPKKVKRAHVVPGLAAHLLILVVKLCDAGYNVVLIDVSSKIWYRQKRLSHVRSAFRRAFG